MRDLDSKQLFSLRQTLTDLRNTYVLLYGGFLARPRISPPLASTAEADACCAQPSPPPFPADRVLKNFEKLEKPKGESGGGSAMSMMF